MRVPKSKIVIDRSIFDLTYIKKILKIVWDCSPGLTVARVVLLVINAILPLIPLYLMKLLLDAFAEDVKPTMNYITWILVGFAVVKILSIIVGQISTYVNLLQSDIVADHMSNIVISKTLHTDMEYFDSDVYHDIFQRAIASSSGRPLQVLGVVMGLVSNLISLAAVVVMLVRLHWGIIAVLVIIAIPVAVIRWYFTDQMVDLREIQTQKDRKAGYFKHVLTSLDYAKEVRIFAYGRKLRDRFLALRMQLRVEKRNLYLKQTRSIGVAQGVESIAIITALGFIAYRAIKGAISVGDIALYYGLFQKGQSNISGVLKSFVSIHENRRYLEHLFTFLDLETKITDPVKPIDIDDKVNTLSFENVSFTYPSTNKKILDDVSFEVKKGEIIAIVGENGSGKTTLVKLITRLYEKNAGKIKINGTDIANFRLSDLRRKFTVIFQMFSKYNATVVENVQWADIEKKIDPNKVVEATQRAHAQKFIETLPNKYQTSLGRSFRQGEELSGGQWQKIALSRAFYKDAEIIVLDEPTSFIDPLAEEDIFASLKKVAENKILVLITHRIYNLRMADKILVMDQGKIVEQGNHAELMAQNGLFKEMFDKQS